MESSSELSQRCTGHALLVSKFQDRNSLLHVLAGTEEAGNN
jgi:hypothetical protein